MDEIYGFLSKELETIKSAENHETVTSEIIDVALLKRNFRIFVELINESSDSTTSVESDDSNRVKVVRNATCCLNKSLEIFTLCFKTQSIVDSSGEALTALKTLSKCCATVSEDKILKENSLEFAIGLLSVL